MKLFSAILQISCFVLPWSIRRFFLISFLGFNLHKKSKIGFSIVLANKVILKKGAKIQNANFINKIDEIALDSYSKIGNYNWITGANTNTSAYKATPNRECVFRLGQQTRITDRHHFDCNGGILIGSFTTIAGLRSQFISHGINLITNQQEAYAIKIGNYCMVGSGVKVLMSSILPDNSVLGAGALLNKGYAEPYSIYAGVPAKMVKKLPSDAKYFHRSEGSVK